MGSGGVESEDMMAPVRTNGDPGIFIIEKWFAIMLAALTILGVGFGLLQAMVLDREMIKKVPELEKRTLRLERDATCDSIDQLNMKQVLDSICARLGRIEGRI
jgi:hypothetical protein